MCKNLGVEQRGDESQGDFQDSEGMGRRKSSNRRSLGSGMEKKRALLIGSQMLKGKSKKAESRRENTDEY